MFENCKEVLQEIASFAIYGAPRFLTIAKLTFKRGDDDIFTKKDFTICFHIISSCPGLKFIIKKALYKAVRYNSVTMSIKQYKYPQRDHNADQLTDIELKVFLNKKCSFCLSNGLLGHFHEPLWRDEHNYLNSSVLFNMSDYVNVKSKIFYSNSRCADVVQETQFNPLPTELL